MLNFGWIISRTSQDSNGKVSPVFSRSPTRELVELVSCWTWFRWDHHHLQTLRRKKSPPLGVLGMMGWWDWFLWVFAGFPSFPKQSRDSRTGASIFEKSPKTTETNTGLSGLTCCSSKTLSDASEKKDQSNQGIVGCTLIPTWAPYGKIPIFFGPTKTWHWKMDKKKSPLSILPWIQAAHHHHTHHRSPPMSIRKIFDVHWRHLWGWRSWGILYIRNLLHTWYIYIHIYIYIIINLLPIDI